MSPETNNHIISPKAGGTITSADRQVTITFRPDGLPEPIMVAFEEMVTVTLPGNFAPRGPQVTIQAHWLDSRQPVNQLDPAARPILLPGAAKPKPPQPQYWATVSMRLAAGQPGTDRLAIARLIPGSQKWEILPTQVNSAMGLALAETERLGAFALIENEAFWGNNPGQIVAAAAIGDEIIVDDLDPGFQHFTVGSGHWEPIPCGPGSCWADHAYWTYNRSPANPGDLDQPVDWVTWTPALTQPGYYYVEAWIPASDATTIGAAYRIYHDGMTDIVSVNQAIVSGAWVPLGPFQFAANGNEYVYLDDIVPEKGEAKVHVGFDAVKFIYAGDDPPPFDPFDFYRRTYGYWPWMAYGGDPVNMTTGQAIQQQQDVSIPAPGFDLAVVRTYNSLDTRAGLFGIGWTSNLDVQLEVRESDGIVLARRADGYTPAFYPQTGGVYQAENGVFDRLEATAAGFTLTQPDGTRYEFDHQGHLQRMIDRRGNGLTFSYSGEQLTQVTDAVGRSLSLTHEGEFVKQITDPLNRTWVYTYENGHLTGVQDANGGVRENKYEAGRLVRFTDPEEIPYLENFYDAQGRVIEQIDAAGSHSFMTYTTILSGSQPYSATIYTDNEGNETTYLYDGLFRVVQIKDPLGHTTSYRYDQDYNRIAVTDARGHTTHYKYDEQGNVVERRDPVESCRAAPYSDDVTEWTYNEHNLVTSMTNALQHTWVYEYDGQGNLVYARAPDGGETRATYNNWGLPLTITDPLKRVTRYAYDNYGNRTQTTDPAGHLTVSHDDLAGREVGYTDANDHTAVFQYDPNDNLTGIADPKGQAHTFVYDRNDLLIESIDRRGVISNQWC
jgi:YD repeat-containing protein